MISILQLEFTISAIVWVPYSFLLFYLFREHYSRSRNLQSNILLFLACGSVFRCVWFFIDNQVYFVVSEVINRIALLLQFSGISLLMLMWSRAIAISKMTDVVYNETAEANTIENGRDTVLVDSRKLRIQRYQEATQAVMSKLTGMNRFQHYIVVTVVVNICVWGFVLGSLSSTTYLWYNINIIAISVACMVAALGTLLVGLWVSIALHIALSPVYVSSAGSATYNQEQRLKCVCMGRYGARCEYLLGCCGLCSLYAFIFNYNQSKDSSRQGLQMQREVLKVILSVSTITSFFFLLRSLCFMYRPVIEPDNADDRWGVVDDISYPFFFYQIPELVPNLVIALGISPPTGVLRQAARYVTYGYRVAVNWLLCGRRGSSARLLQPQQSVYDSECGTMSPAVRPSFLPDASMISAISAAPLPASTSSAPIAIPIRRNQPDANNVTNSTTASATASATTSATTSAAASAAAQSARDKRNFKTTGDGATRTSTTTAGTAPGDLEQPAAAEDHHHHNQDNNETLSPVHDTTNTNNPETAKNSSLYSRDTGSIGNMSTFQVEKPSEEPKNSSLGTFFSFLGGSRANKSLSGRSTGDLSGSVGSYPTSPNSIGNGAGRRRSAPRNRDQSGDYNDNDNEDEDDAWTQERRNSAEIAEMLYRINSFSTSEMTSGAQTLASSLTSGTGTSRTQSLQSVDSNTITNSRRHHIADIIGGNRSVTPGPSTSTTKRGWFS